MFGVSISSRWPVNGIPRFDCRSFRKSTSSIPIGHPMAMIMRPAVTDEISMGVDQVTDVIHAFSRMLHAWGRFELSMLGKKLRTSII